MWQIHILWIHTISYLKATSSRNHVSTLKRVEITITLRHSERINLADVFTTILVAEDGDKFESDSIIESLLVNNILELIFFERKNTDLQNEFLRRV